jgi:hypothetical protein
LGEKREEESKLAYARTALDVDTGSTHAPKYWQQLETAPGHPRVEMDLAWEQNGVFQVEFCPGEKGIGVRVIASCIDTRSQEWIR